jgi:hypothetical protein
MVQAKDCTLNSSLCAQRVPKRDNVSDGAAPNVTRLADAGLQW